MAVIHTPFDFSPHLFYQPRKSLMDSQFWLVWNPDNSKPTHRHGSQELAKAEADRLSIKHPGQKFYVLEAVGYSTKRECEWVSFDDVRPF